MDAAMADAQQQAQQQQQEAMAQAFVQAQAQAQAQHNAQMQANATAATIAATSSKIARKPQEYTGSKKDPSPTAYLDTCEVFFIATSLPQSQWTIICMTMFSPALQSLMKNTTPLDQIAAMPWAEFKTLFCAVAAGIGKQQAELDLIMRAMSQYTDPDHPRPTTDTIVVLDPLFNGVTSVVLPDIVKIAMTCKAIHPSLCTLVKNQADGQPWSSYAAFRQKLISTAAEFDRNISHIGPLRRENSRDRRNHRRNPYPNGNHSNSSNHNGNRNHNKSVSFDV